MDVEIGHPTSEITFEIERSTTIKLLVVVLKDGKSIYKDLVNKVASEKL